MDFAALQHSVFLQALGSAILNSLWQCFLLWLIYETISVSYKSASTRFKNNLATLLLFLSFTWFLTTFVSKIFYHSNVAAVAAMPGQPGTEPGHLIQRASSFRILLSYGSASLPYLSVAYIFLLCFLAAKLVIAYRYVHFISGKRLKNPTVELQLFASKVAREIGIRKKIGVWISHHIDVPATIGFIKPVILIPLASINNLSANQLEAIILHELAHIKRNDYFTNLIISAIETILFFNPFVVLLSNIIKRERENCCDDFVLQYRYDPHSYASALLRLEESRMVNLKLAIGAISGKKQLLSRIKRITSSQVASRQFNYGQKIIALLLVTALICSVAWLSPEEKKPTPKVMGQRIITAPVSKTRAIKTITQQVEVIVADKQNESLILPATNTRRNSVKAAPPELDEASAENPSQLNSPEVDAGDLKTDDNADYFKVDDKPAYGVTANVKQPGFFFDVNNIKFPSFDGFQKMLLENLNINIDLSKIDSEKLNADLKKAYQQINASDWKELRREITKNFSQINAKLTSKQPDALFYSEKAKAALQDILRVRQQRDHSKLFLEQVKKQMLLQDSAQTRAMALLNETNNKMQQSYQMIQRKQTNDRTGNYYFNYPGNNPTTDNSLDNNDEDENTSCGQKDDATSDICKKGLRISIRRVSKHTGVLNDRKHFQFTFYIDEKPKGEKVIDVEESD
jgi:beta-lactamase regulating signal transducer with metallopeptidase domain